MNDVMAQGAISGLRALQVRVPLDAAVAGFDDIPSLQDYDPSLTTFRLPLQQIGEQAVALALAGDAGATVSIEGSVVLRASTELRAPALHETPTATGSVAS